MYESELVSLSLEIILKMYYASFVFKTMITYQRLDYKMYICVCAHGSQTISNGRKKAKKPKLAHTHTFFIIHSVDLHIFFLCVFIVPLHCDNCWVYSVHSVLFSFSYLQFKWTEINGKERNGMEGNEVKKEYEIRVKNANGVHYAGYPKITTNPFHWMA